MSDDVKKENNREECTTCRMNETMMSLAVAHMSRGAVDDEEKRGECMKWPSDIQPEEVKSAKDLMKETYARTGIKGLARLPLLYEQLARTTIIEEVGGKLERGEEVSEDEMKAYREFTEEDKRQGI